VNILVCGVGGQGVLLFSDIISDLALRNGLDIKKSEVHGLAQRGGSVTSHIRFGPNVYSPLIEEGTADAVVAFERLEALRYVHFLSPSGRLFYDSHRIDPLPVSIGAAERVPDDQIETRLAARAPHRQMVPAFKTALELGNVRVQNTVMLGAVSSCLGFPDESIRQSLTELVKPAARDLNLKAFAAGQAISACPSPGGLPLRLTSAGGA
jgi:indolepyruvate ferredoxin oxidoreductase beta subunit